MNTFQRHSLGSPHFCHHFLGSLRLPVLAAMQIGACMTGQAQMHAMDLAPVSWKTWRCASPDSR